MCDTWFLLSISLMFTGMMSQPTDSTHAEGKDAHEQRLVSQDNLFCGGILREFSTNVRANDTDVQSIQQFAVDYVTRHYPKTISRDKGGNPLPPDVYNPRKLKLQYTKDGKTPFVYQEESLVNGHLQIQRRKSIVGITYFLTLVWRSAPTGLQFQHNFVIRKDRKHQLHMHGHTFYQPTKDVLHRASTHVDKLTSIGDISHARPVFLPVSTMTLDSQSDCLQDSHVISKGQSECKEQEEEQRENVWEESKQNSAHLAKSEDEKQLINSSLNIVSYNIWNFNSVIKNPSGKFYNERINHLGHVIAAAQADIIGYQEVRFDASQDAELGPSQVTHIAKHLPNYQFVYQPAMTYESMVQEGLAIFSKYPILYHDFILLSKDEEDGDDFHQRICLHAEIETPSLGMVHVFVAHLSLSQAARERSVVEIWRYMSQHTGPAVLMGDLNAQPNTKEYRFLTGAVELQGLKTDGLVDAWTVLYPEPRPDAPGVYTADEKRDYGLTFSTLEEHLRSRIDYIFVRLPKDIKLNQVSVLDDGERSHRAASDHIGVQASLRLSSE